MRSWWIVHDIAGKMTPKVMSKILFLSLLMFTMDESHKIKCYFPTIRYYKEMFDDVFGLYFLCVPQNAFSEKWGSITHFLPTYVLASSISITNTNLYPNPYLTVLKCLKSFILLSFGPNFILKIHLVRMRFYFSIFVPRIKKHISINLILKEFLF